MAVPEVIVELIDRFNRNFHAYHYGQYNETQLRHEFMGPFFKALGWDVDNEMGHAEAYKDVIHEDAIKIGGATKAPDYCFRIGGARKFFVETKRPSVNVKEEPSPSFQLRRYAWSAKLPLSILSNFEEFAVYDCRVKPATIDKASTARVVCLNYREFSHRWNEIASVFSRESVLRGSFDEYAESTKAKKGTAEVDAAFLTEIESWRDILARNIALRNPRLTKRELNFAVQHTIDRIIFLRICEDRGIEIYGRLKEIQSSDDIYRHLCQMFQQADDRYNSGLFHFHKEKGRPEPPDTLTPNLIIDDKPFKEIIRRLYYPDSPYEFSVLPADILGQVYEQFLGRIIRLTPAHHAVVEYKPEVKKAGGIYYTPTFIVDYIVTQTLGELLRGKTPRQIADIRRDEGLYILDPACGSGSFLIAAYQYLLDWYRDYYISDGPQKWDKGHQACLCQTQYGDWRLTTSERKRILLNHIFGVDIDSQAVEVTKLSLLLKVLEGENEGSLDRQLSMFQERALPDLSSNIKCGNSLIGSDFYDNKQMSLLDDEERFRVNVFDWKREFPSVMSIKRDGFDAVIGNPPYTSWYSRQALELGQEEESYLRAHYRFLRNAPAKARIHSTMFFLEMSYNILRENGICRMIVDQNIHDYPFKPIRKYIAERVKIVEVVNNIAAFRRVGSGQTIVAFMKSKPITNNRVRIKSNGIKSDPELVDQHLFLQAENDYSWMPCGTSVIIKKIEGEKTRFLQDEVNVISGVAVNATPEGEKQFISQTRRGKEYYPFLQGGKSIDKPYCSFRYSKYLKHDKDLEAKLNDEFERRYLKEKGSHQRPFNLRRMEEFDRPKIFLRQSDVRLTATFVDELVFGNYSLFTIFDDSNDEVKLKFLLGLINSKLLSFYAIHKNIILIRRGKTPQIRSGQRGPIGIRQLPIPTIHSSDVAGKACRDQIVKLVDRMLELFRQISAAKVAHDKTALQRQIDATERQINQLVYELYGLTENERGVVEQIT
jgi:hypothetical protein